MSSPPEAPREQVESAFTPPLRRILELDASILGVVFVDSGGECVDYCSRIAPYEVKVLGAVMDLLLRGLRPSLRRLGGGGPWLVHALTERGSMMVRAVDDEYLLALLASAELDPDEMQADLELAAGELREAAGLVAATWEPSAQPSEVSLRAARGWPHAPASFRTSQGTHQVDAVLGRWEEQHPLAGLRLECFRVRTLDGDELTLCRDHRTGRWSRT